MAKLLSLAILLLALPFIVGYGILIINPLINPLPDTVQLSLLMFRIQIIPRIIFIVLAIVCLSFYSYTIFVRRYWAFILITPLQIGSLVIAFFFASLFGTLEIVDSYKIQDRDYHLVGGNTVNGSHWLDLFICEEDWCDRSYLGYRDSTPITLHEFVGYDEETQVLTIRWGDTYDSELVEVKVKN